MAGKKNANAKTRAKNGTSDSKPTIVSAFDRLATWMRLGARLLHAAPEKFDEIATALECTVDVQETIAEYDWQLWTGKRPNKVYEA